MGKALPVQRINFEKIHSLEACSETMEGNRWDTLKSAFCKHKHYILLLTVSALVIAALLSFFVYQMKFNRDLIDSAKSKDARSGASLSGLPVASQSGNLVSDDVKKYAFGVVLDYNPLDCQGPNYKTAFPDLDYALMGYNVLRGYPLAKGHDPGFTYPIFVADYNIFKQTADCRYSVPQGLVIVPDVSCVTSFSSQVVQTQYEFSKSLSVSAHVSGGGFGVSFSASAGYKESSSTVASGESVSIISSAKCNYYFSKLLKRDLPKFDPNFLKWIRRLSNSNSKEDYIEFFDTFGTHFATEVTFGARFTYEYTMSSQKYEAESEKEVNVAVEASYAGLFSVGGGFSMDSSQRQKASNFLKSVTTKTVTVGAAPPANGDAMTWASTVKDNPVPTKYKLSSIETLFAEYYKDNSDWRVNVSAITKNIERYKMEYCKYLMTKGEVDSCEELPPGMILDKTRLYNHYEEKRSSYSECINYCLKYRKCVAITYCDKCQSANYQYKICYLYSNDDQGQHATEESGWKSVFVLGKMKQKFKLAHTQVIGVERGFEKEEDKSASASRCYELCLEDAYCMTYSHCESSKVEVKCKLYSLEKIFEDISYKTKINNQVNSQANNYFNHVNTHVNNHFNNQVDNLVNNEANSNFNDEANNYFNNLVNYQFNDPVDNLVNSQTNNQVDNLFNNQTNNNFNNQANNNFNNLVNNRFNNQDDYLFNNQANKHSNYQAHNHSNYQANNYFSNIINNHLNSQFNDIVNIQANNHFNNQV